MDRELFIIAHDIRSAHNIGALFRLADGMAVTRLYISGYSPYPSLPNDTRLPHINQKLTKQIEKTALGATATVPWEHVPDIYVLLEKLKLQDVQLIGLEQSERSTTITSFTPHKKTAIVLGREVEGIDAELLAHCSEVVEIPMLGKKESHNVVQAAAIMMYHCRFIQEVI